MEKSHLNRREFLVQAALLLPATGLFAACGRPVGALPTASISRNSNNVYTLDLTLFTALQAVGGTAHISVDAASGTRDLYVTRVSSSSVIAVSTQCTYGSCVLASYDSTVGVYRCLCHGCIFDGTGAVVSGPATQALSSYIGTLSSASIQFTIP